MTFPPLPEQSLGDRQADPFAAARHQRSNFRFLAPLIADAGYRVASVDPRGHGESSTGWDSYTRTDTAGDLVAVIEKLSGPATIVGQSFSGESATIAAATGPDLVSAIVGVAPFTHTPKSSMGALQRNDHDYRRGALLLGRFLVSGSVKTWSKYLNVAYPWPPSIQQHFYRGDRI